VPLSLKIFRVVLQVSSIEAAQRFYTELFGAPGRLVGGGRLYFDCGGVWLSLQDSGQKPVANSDDLYIAVDALEAFHARAKKLGCLSQADVHGKPGGEIVKRPWGERSFYAQDPDGNGLCFVDEKTLFTGQR
jgi:catechol 2,3-dioxygenase-like lactoylglutathione lyase family enzyme